MTPLTLKTQVLAGKGYPSMANIVNAPGMTEDEIHDALQELVQTIEEDMEGVQVAVTKLVRHIMDSTVYNTDTIKKPMLEMLEKVRRSETGLIMSIQDIIFALMIEMK